VSVRIEFHRRLRQAIAPVIGACLFGYFVFHAVQGDRGIIAWLQIGAQLEENRAMLAALTAERRELQHRVSLLSPTSLDPDLLDERARLMLNVAEPEDRLVIIRDKPPGQGGTDD
jgi:cell division protein FtsB